MQLFQNGLEVLTGRAVEAGQSTDIAAQVDQLEALINEYTQEVGALRSDLQEITQEKDKLSNELDKKNDYMTMEKYASSVLGMESSESGEQVYIEVGEDDSIEVFEVEEDGTRGVIATVMSALSQNFIEAWNTLTDSE